MEIKKEISKIKSASHSSSSSNNSPEISSLPVKPKDIKIKPQLIKENYDEDFVETLITNFVEKDYEEKRTNIEEAWKSRDAAKLYYNCHSFKTTARMLYIEDFAMECQGILNCATPGKEDWNKLDILVPQFLQDFKLIYEDACEIYDKEFKPKPVEILEDLPDNESYTIDNSELIAKNLINKSVDKSVDSIDNICGEENYENYETQYNGVPDKKRDSETIDKVYDLENPSFLSSCKVQKSSSKTNVNKIPNLKLIEENINTTSKFFNTNYGKTAEDYDKTPRLTPDDFQIDNLFKIEESKIKIKSNAEMTAEFKEKIKNKYIENELKKIKLDFSKAIESQDKDKFLKALRSFKTTCLNYNFTNLALKVDEWEWTINKFSKFAELHININDIARILNVMLEEVNRIPSLFISNGQYNSSSISVFPQKSRIEELNSSMHKPSYISPIPNKRTLGPSAKTNALLSQVAFNKSDDDLIYQELKPIKFEGLYKKDISSEELAEEIKRITQDENLLNPATPTKFGSASLRGVRSNLFSDNAYPFKQDCFKFHCNIF